MIEYKIIKGDSDTAINDAYFIRDMVFTKEQGYPTEIEIDEYDKIAWHCIMYKDGTAIGTARMIPQARTGKIGRVAILKDYRGAGLGNQLMEALMKEAEKQNLEDLSLSSQVYAIEFYEKLGFAVSGEQYLEEGEPHIHMTKSILSGTTTFLY